MGNIYANDWNRIKLNDDMQPAEPNYLVIHNTTRGCFDTQPLNLAKSVTAK